MISKNIFIQLCLTILMCSCNQEVEEINSLTPCYNLADNLYKKIETIENTEKSFSNSIDDVYALKSIEIKDLYFSFSSKEYGVEDIDWVDVSIIALIKANNNNYEIWQVYPFLVRVSFNLNPESSTLEGNSPPYPYRHSR